MDKAQAYFSTIASSYHEREQSLLAAIRRREAAAVDEAVGEVGGLEVLDLGCGAGFYAVRAQARGARRVVAADAVAGMVENLPEGIEGRVGDAAALRLDETFDRVISAGLLEFVPDPAAVFATIAAHLAPRGRAAILFPVRRLTVVVYYAFHLSHGVRIGLFGRGDIERLAAAAGMQVDSFRNAGPFAGVAALTRRSG